MPKYLLLFGDAVWDCRMLTPECRSLNADDYLLAHESENSFSETDCYVNDGWMTLLDEGEGGASIRNDKEDVAVGRIPVTTAAEAKAVVDKIIAYANNAHAGDWANTIMFMGDDGNNNLHMRDVDATAEYIGQLYPGYQIKKVMWDAYTRVSTSTGNRYPEVSRLLKQQQQAGALVMDYAGHGVENQIYHQRLPHVHQSEPAALDHGLLLCHAFRHAQGDDRRDRPAQRAGWIRGLLGHDAHGLCLLQ